MSLFSYQELVSLLQRNVATVTFLKVDGTTRVMRCTLQLEYLPESEQEALMGKSMLTEDDGENETLAVYDLEIGNWRSFRVANVISVYPHPAPDALVLPRE